MSLFRDSSIFAPPTRFWIKDGNLQTQIKESVSLSRRDPE